MPQSSRRFVKNADRAQRRALGAGGEGGADLAGDDAGEGHRRRLQVGVVERRCRLPVGVAGLPAGAEQHEEERRPCTSAASTAPRKTQARKSSARSITPSRARPRRPLHQPGLGGLAAERERGRISVPRSIARICSTVSGSGIAPPESAKTRNGHDLGRRVGEDVEDELADVVVDPPARLDRGDDRGEVVVGEHHRRRLARDVGARTGPSRRRCRPAAAPARR